jgi:hypothetical protein
MTALAALVGAGLLTTVQQSYNTPTSIVGIGNIASQNPAAGATVAAGTNVIIVISAGVAPVAGNGYDKWGATGGGITAVNAPEPLGQALANAMQPDNAVYAANQSVLATLARGTAINQNTPAYQVPVAPTMGPFGFGYGLTDVFYPYVYFTNTPVNQHQGNVVPVAWTNGKNTAVDWV